MFLEGGRGGNGKHAVDRERADYEHICLDCEMSDMTV